MIKIYGNDVERVLKFISGINSTFNSVINSLSNVDIDEDPVNITHITNPVLVANTTMQNINKEMKLIESKAFKNIYNLNNSYGSPYTELYSLSSSIQSSASIVSRYPSVRHYSDISDIISKLKDATYYIVDAKYSVIAYNDHMQQGYDKVIHKIDF